MAETWYRPERYIGTPEVEEILVVGETPEFIKVEYTDWKGKLSVRREAKNGAVRTKRECLENMLESAKSAEQRARDELSRKIQNRTDVERMLKELT